MKTLSVSIMIDEFNPDDLTAVIQAIEKALAKYPQKRAYFSVTDGYTPVPPPSPEKPR